MICFNEGLCTCNQHLERTRRLVMDEIKTHPRGQVVTVRANHIMYVLACDHVVMSSPSLITDGKIWCGDCKVNQRMTGVHVFEWRARCEVCNYGRWCGLSEMLANRLADQHERSRMHKMTVEYTRNPNAIHELGRLRDGRAL